MFRYRDGEIPGVKHRFGVGAKPNHLVGICVIICLILKEPQGVEVKRETGAHVKPSWTSRPKKDPE